MLVAGRLGVTLPLAAAILAFVINPDWMAWSAMGIPTWLRWAGVFLGAASIPGVYWILTALGTNVSETVLVKPKHELVTTGPYRWVRHPLYTVGLTLLLALALVAANLVLLLFVAVVAVLIRFVVIPREEAVLVGRFGSRYRRYMSRAGRLLPRAFSRHDGSVRGSSPGC
jgi:protein-S-isoprenylcysteine O-methyltransferase Ste14